MYHLLAHGMSSLLSSDVLWSHLVGASTPVVARTAPHNNLPVCGSVVGGSGGDNAVCCGQGVFSYRIMLGRGSPSYRE